MTSATADCMRIQHKLAYLMTLLNFSWWDTTVHIMQRLMHKFHVGKFFHGEATYVTPWSQLFCSLCVHSAVGAAAMPRNIMQHYVHRNACGA